MLVVLAVLALGGCGSSDDEVERFDEEGYRITFEYPGELDRTDDVELSETAGQAQDTLALGLSDESAIFVQRYRLRQEVSGQNADAARRELDAVLSRLSGTEVEGEPIEVGDLPSFRYELDRLDTPEDGRSTIIVILDGRNEYFLNCQSVPDERDELEQACDQMIETLEPTGGS
jgi:hypothetical protein